MAFLANRSWRDRLICRLLLLAACLLPSEARAARLTIIGNLRFLAANFVTVRLPDGRIIDARLPKTGFLTSASLQGKYRLGDDVQISCRTIAAEFDSLVNRYHTLEVTRIRFLRAPTPTELTRVTASLSWQQGHNLLRPSDVALAPRATLPVTEVLPGFERIREVNLARLERMPNFVADEKASRLRKSKASAMWQLVNTIESETAFRRREIVRQNVRVILPRNGAGWDSFTTNGTPWSNPAAWLPGANWGSGFGSDLQPLFRRDCSNEFAFEGRQEMHGNQVLAYSFHAPPDGCFGPSVLGYQQFAAGQKGRILAEEATGNVIQVERKSVGTPDSIGGTSVVLTWENVKIGDASYLLPVAEDWIWDGTRKGDMWQVLVQYANYRHFEAASAIQFH